ncbi:MAG: M16 family metallopeptidase [Pyrinomonadaceae bacterium]
MFQRKFLYCILMLAAAAGIAAAQSTSAAPRQEKLLNGLRVLMWSDASQPKVTIRLRIHAGASFDPQEREGVMKLLSEAIFPNDDARNFFTEDLEGELKIECNYDYIEIAASAKPDSYLALIETLASAVITPVLDKATTDVVKARLVKQVIARELNAGAAADLAVRRRLFQTFPYGRPIAGSTKSLNEIDFADLRFAYDRLFGADNATLAISGNFPVDNGYRAVRRYFGSWLKSDKKIPSTFKQPDPPPPATQIAESPEAGVTEIRYALRGVARNDKDYAAATVLANIYESRFKSKAPEERRANMFVRNYSNVLPGVLIFGISNIRSEMTTSVTTEKPKFEANDMMSAVLNDKITDAEFSVGKLAATTDYNKQDSAARWLDADTYKLASVKADQEAFAKLSLADVQRIADRLKQQPVASVLLLSQKTSN